MSAKNSLEIKEKHGEISIILNNTTKINRFNGIGSTTNHDHSVHNHYYHDNVNDPLSSSSIASPSSSSSSVANVSSSSSTANPKKKQKVELQEFPESIMNAHAKDIFLNKSAYLTKHLVLDMRNFKNPHTVYNPITNKVKAFSNHCIHCRAICHLMCLTCHIMFKYMESSFICTTCGDHEKKNEELR